MTQNYDEITSVAREYYNSSDADTFYYEIWGGEDLHLGIYESEDDPVFDASRRIIDRMASYSKQLGKDGISVLDLGGGFGGTARYLAQKFGAHVTNLNLSEAENERGRRMNREQGLDHLIEMVDGTFEDVPRDDETFDIVWSQDAILHSGNREKVIAEAARVLKPGGELIFTDPMQTDTCPPDVLGPIYERINLSSLGSPGFYRETAKKYGFEERNFEEMAHNLTMHYWRILQETKNREQELKDKISEDYINRMKKGLQHWVDGGKNGYLTWGIFYFVKQ
jgi:sarcosine/dimethylglycine N-methyltransferase